MGHTGRSMEGSVTESYLMNCGVIYQEVLDETNLSA